MNKIGELNERIEELRDRMNRLIEQKEETLDEEVINVSKMLDNLLNEYEGAIRGKKIKHENDI